MQKVKKSKWNYIKLKTYYAQQNIIKMNRESTVWEDICEIYTSDEGLISKIYKEIIQLDTKKTNNPIKK